MRPQIGALRCFVGAAVYFARKFRQVQVMGHLVSLEMTFPTERLPTYGARESLWAGRGRTHEDHGESEGPQTWGLRFRRPQEGFYRKRLQRLLGASVCTALLGLAENLRPHLETWRAAESPTDQIRLYLFDCLK